MTTLKSADNQPEVIQFERDMTLLWPCRRGDFILWMRFSSILSGPESVQICDLWEMGDGYHVTITNRPEDFPAWFELHPTEVCDGLAFKMEAAIRAGRYPKEPMIGPNLWRLRVGDRVAWIGAERSERRSVNGILAVVECQECALAVGQGNFSSLGEYMVFGTPTTSTTNPTDIARGHAAVKFVQQLGLPWTWGSTWHIG